MKTNFAVVLFLLFITNSILAKDFYWLNPFPSLTSINSVEFIDANIGYAAGDLGFIMKTTNQGKSWIQLSTNLAFNILNISFINAEIGFVCGEEGNLAKTTDGGNSWTQYKLDTKSHLIYIKFFNETNGVVNGSRAHFKTTDGGNTWNLINSKQSAETVFFVNENIGFCSVIPGTWKTYKTTDGGSTWKEITKNGASALYFINDQKGWIGKEYGYLLHTSDGGTTWNEQISGNENTIKDITFIDEDNGIAIGIGGSISMTNNGGKTWFKKDSKTGLTLLCSKYLTKEKVIIFGTQGIYIESNNGGKEFEIKNQSFLTEIMKKSEYYSNKSAIEVSGDAVTSGKNNIFLLITQAHYVGSQLKYFYSYLKSTDKGKTWTEFPFDPDFQPYYINFVNENVGFIQGYDSKLKSSAVLKSSDAGNSWHKLGVVYPENLSGVIYILSFVSENIVFVKGITGLNAFKLFYSIDGAKSWKANEELLWGKINHIFYLNDQNIWLVSESDVYHTSNKGENWKKISTIKSGLSNNYVFFFNSNEGFYYKDGNKSGEFYYTNDGGYSWAMVKSNDNITPYCADIIDGVGYIYAYNKIYTTYDNGQTWNVEYITHCGNEFTKISGFYKDNIIASAKNYSNIKYNTYLINNQYERPLSVFVDIKDEQEKNNLSLINNKIVISPNPASDFINFDFDDFEFQISYVQIFNSNGNLVYKSSYDGIINHNRQIDISYLPSGVYFVVTTGLSINHGIFIKK